MEREEVGDGVFSSISLPCGRTVQNRLVKVALYEHLADFKGGSPNKFHYNLYAKWAQYKWGMVITGNVQVLNTHLTLGRDVVLPKAISKDTLRPFNRLLSSIRGPSNSNGTLAIMQLSHAGRQSTNVIGGRAPFQRPLGPSSVRVGVKNGGWLSDLLHGFAFQTPYEMTTADIDDVVEAFVKGAMAALESGFDGVELHAAHGYLLAQFISPKSNVRSDGYSAHPSTALRLLHRIVLAIREAVPKEFVLGIKINAADYTESNEDSSPNSLHQEDRALNHISTIASWDSVDFIEISGGDYEKPDFMASQQPKSRRQALFARFSEQAIKTLESLPRGASSPPLPLILLTGGLRTPELLHTALSSRHAQLLGIGRGSVLSPDLPNLLQATGPTQISWNQPFRPEPDLDTSAYWPLRWFWKYLPSMPLLGAGVGTAWYVVMMRSLATPNSREPNLASGPEATYRMGGLGAIFWMWMWVDWTIARVALTLASLVLIVGIIVI